MASTILGIEITHRIIIVVLCAACFLHNAITNGAMNVVVSSLQKEFYLSGKESGYYLSSYDLGSVVCSFIIPIVSSRSSKPRWIAFGMLVLFFGTILTSLPHFMRKSDFASITNDVSDKIELCNSSVVNNTLTRTTTIKPAMEPTVLFGFLHVKHILFMANIINGLSSASMQSVMISYLEDVVPHELTSAYESYYFITGAFGMGAGFIFTSWCLTINSDFHDIDVIPEWLIASHPNWVGAWWIPFFTLSFIALIFVAIIFFFPTKLEHESKHVLETENGTKMAPLASVENIRFLESKDQQLTTDLENHTSFLAKTGSTMSVYTSRTNKESYNFLHFLKETFSLFLNPVFLALVVTGTIEGLLQNAFLAFISLYLEYQYRISPAQASISIGLLTLPPVFIGGLLSGKVCQKLENKLLPLLKYIAWVLIFNVIFYAGFFVYCPQPNLISPSSIDNPNYQLLLGENGLISNITCFKTASNCGCDSQVFKPVCLSGSNDIYFQSPCLAGCSKGNNDYYSDCSQSQCGLYFERPELVSEKSTFVNGLCPRDASCDIKLYFTFVSIFLLMLSNALLYTAYIKVLIGSVMPKGIDEKSDEAKKMNTVALGLKQFFMNAVGTIPGPILFGSVIDLSCKYWHIDSEAQMTCKLYNNMGFSFSFSYLGMGFKFVCLSLVLFSFFYTKYAKKK